MIFTKYRRVVGRIIHARGSLHDVRLDIDVAGSRIKNVFSRDVELEKLHGAKVMVYIPQVNNKKKEKKEHKKAA